MAKASNTICDKVYVDKEGKEYRNLPEDPSVIVGRRFKFSNGETRLVEPKGFPKNILHGAVLTGLGYVGAASLNNADGDVAEAVKLFDRRMALLAEGQWASRPEGGGGGRDSIIVEAVLAAAEEAGRSPDPDKVRDYFLASDIEVEEGDKEAEKARNAERSKRKAEFRKRADVERHYQRIRAERAAEAAAKAGKAEGGETEGAPDFDAF